MDTETRSSLIGDTDRVLDLTRDCANFASGRGDGLLDVFVPHATAGIAILETGAGNRPPRRMGQPSLKDDASGAWAAAMRPRVRSSHEGERYDVRVIGTT